MNNTAEQFIATNKANLQTLEGLTTEAFAGIGKLVELNLATSKSLLSESFNHVQAVLDAKDAQELQAVQTGLLKPLTDKSAAYAEQVKTIITDSSAELTNAIQAKTAETQKAFTGVVENLAKNAPAGSEAAVEAFKNAMTAAQNVVESAQVQIKKAVETAQSNFTAATNEVVDVTAKVSKRR